MKGTQYAGSVIRKGVIKGSDLEQNLTHIVWVAIRCCFKTFFMFLNSVQHIIISVLRFNIAHNCSQGQPYVMALLAAVILNRRARTERNVANRK